MPDIRLQDYIAKIKGLIREGRQDEAIAHSQHILRQYPKHIETYATLGEACLEKELHREAIEFFQRTLGGDPESFIARVGLGIIFDGQGALPEAIWQIERAFELAPGNAEVRRVLQRLYAQRDGVEKTKLKLTRGALGRLYSRNGLYERAISEFQAILRQDPDLADIRVALAEALWREGRRLEAAEVCQDILRDLPNCLKANLILGTIWMSSGNEEAGEERLALARALDPENRIAHDMMGAESPLPPEEVSIPELEALPETLDIVPVAKDDLSLAWEMEEEEEEFATDLLPATVGEPGEGQAEEEMPDWMVDVGIVAEPGEEEPAEEEAEEPVEEPVAEVAEPSPAAEMPAEEGEEEIPTEEEIPEWLQGLEAETEGPVEEPAADLAEPSPAAEMPAEEGKEEIPTEEEIPEWLQELEAAEAEELAAEVAEPSPGAEVAAEEEIPEWLRELKEEEAEEPAADVAEPSPAAEEAPKPPPGVPASLWALVVAGILSEDDVESAMAEMSEEDLEAQQAEEIPEWLKQLTAEEPVSTMEPLVPADSEAAIPEGEEAGVLPEWTAEIEVPQAEELEPPVEEVAPEVEAPVLEEAEEVPEWARGLAPPEAEEEKALEPEEVEAVAADAGAVEEIEEAEEIPEWLRELETAGAEESPAGEEEEIPEWLQDAGLPEAEGEEELEPEAEAPPEVAEEEVIATEAGEVEEIEEVPEWLMELEVPEEVPAEEEGIPAAEVEEIEEEELPEWLQDLGLPEIEEEEFEPEAEALPEEGEEEVLAAEAEEIEAEEIPEWLQDLGLPEIEEEEFEPEAEALPEEGEEEVLAAEVEQVEELEEFAEGGEEIPEWLRELDTLEAEAEPAGVAEEGEEIPEWLQELEEPEAEEMAPAAEEPAPKEAAVEEGEEIPEWLQELEEPEAEEMAPAAQEPEAEAEMPVEREVEELPDWVKELAALDLEWAKARDQAEVEESLVAEEVEELPEALVEVEVPEAEEVGEAALEAEAPVEEAVAEVAETLAEMEVPEAEEVGEIVLVEEVLVEEVVAEVPEGLGEVEALEAEEVPEEPALEAEEIEAPAAVVPESLQALVDAGILDESDLEAAIAEMTDEELAAQGEEAVPGWLRQMTGEGAAPAEELAEERESIEEPSATKVPESLQALLDAGILDESDLEAAMAEMTDEELAAQQAEAVPEWLRELTGEEAAPTEEEVPVAEGAAPPVEEVVPEVKAAAEAEAILEEAALVAGEPAEAPPTFEAPAEIVVEAEPALEEAVIEPPESGVLEELEVAAEAEEAAAVQAEVEQEAGPPTDMEMVAPYDRVQLEEELEAATQIRDLQERLRGQPRDFEARLELARLFRSERDWNAAMNHYEKLISARQFLPSVIEELGGLVDEELNLPRLYQLIGDAHMQEGDLDKALEMYRTAQKTLMK